MTLRKISSHAQKYCSHPEHNPPSHIVLEAGIWEHICPGCQKVVRFQVPNVSWMYAAETHSLY